MALSNHSIIKGEKVGFDSICFNKPMIKPCKFLQMYLFTSEFFCSGYQSCGSIESRHQLNKSGLKLLKKT